MSELGDRALRIASGIQVPEGFRAYMRDMYLDREYLAAKCIGKKEVEALSEYEGVYDARYAEYPAIESGRSAVLTCSACGGQTVVRYQKQEGVPAEVEWWSPTDAVSLHQCYGHDMVCPQCGTECRLYGVKDFRYGRVQETEICVPYVQDGILLLARYIVTRKRYACREEWAAMAIDAYAFDGKKHVRLTQYRKNPFRPNQYMYTGWEERERFRDELCRCNLYDQALQSLDGTEVENCRLWDFYRQSRDAEVFCPAAWMRLWQKHKNADVLMDAGMGVVIGKMLVKECESISYGYYGSGFYTAPKLAMIDWKKKKPSAMMGMTRNEVARLAKADYSVDALRVILAHKGEGKRMMDLLERCRNRVHEMEAVLKLPYKAERVLGYLEKQGRGSVYLKDYWRMAEECGMDLAQDAVRWPKDLTREHDRVSEILQNIKREREEKENATAWLAMNRKLEGLVWEKDGICIRPAHSTAELVAEGQKLRHCVGGYTKSHLEGRIILFIRHTRRPERSWYTLNIDLKKKTRIQLHGYGNERNRKGEVLHIPREVLAFVDEWEKTVLAQWQEPKEKGEKEWKTG